MGKEWDKLGWDTRNIYDSSTGLGRYLNKNRPRYQIGIQAQLWHIQWLTEVYRVLKPGASMLVMGGTRTSHRLACAIEDSGFVIKDTLMWIYGSGFPKAQDLGKMIDKRKNWCSPDKFAELIKGKRLEKNISITQMDKDVCNGTTNYSWFEGRPAGIRLPRLKEYQKIKKILKLDNKWDSYFEEAEREKIRKGNAGLGKNNPAHEGGFKADYDISNPATDLAKHWDGFKVGGIKPSYEPIIWAVKPPEGSYVDNVLKWGVGAVNVDECRVGTNEDLIRPNVNGFNKGSKYANPNKENSTCDKTGIYADRGSPKGRFPANIILSHHPECVQVGVKRVKGLGGSGRASDKGHGFQTEYVAGEKKGEGFSGGFVDKDGLETVESWDCHPDCAVRILDEQSGDRKTTWISSRHKNRRSGEFLRQLGHPKEQGFNDSGGASRFYYCAKASRAERNAGLEGMEKKEAFNYGHKENPGRVAPKKSYPRTNNHPTVKPIKLFEWLIKLITREGQIILDPFIGSGTTFIAAHNTERKCIGIEKEGEYIEIAKRRAMHWRSRPRQLEMTGG